MKTKAAPMDHTVYEHLSAYVGACFNLHILSTRLCKAFELATVKIHSFSPRNIHPTIQSSSS